MNVLLYKTFDTHTAGGCVNALSDSVGGNAAAAQSKRDFISHV